MRLKRNEIILLEVLELLVAGLSVVFSPYDTDQFSSFAVKDSVTTTVVRVPTPDRISNVDRLIFLGLKASPHWSYSIKR